MPSDDVGEMLDFDQVLGQHQAKRALEIVAAGGHHLLMVGSPGGRKDHVGPPASGHPAGSHPGRGYRRDQGVERGRTAASAERVSSKHVPSGRRTIRPLGPPWSAAERSCARAR